MHGKASAPSPTPPVTDGDLFRTPPDLVCPITQDLFVDPVLNCCGQVYERSAIERHMRINHTDPLTNSQLASDVLTPVFPMRSRAAAYREQAAAAAAARAAAPDCAEPLKYLRRAAELLAPCYAPPTAGGLPMAAPKVAGLSADFVRYLQQNHGAAYDTLALKYYANELRRGGNVEAASAVLYRLLLAARDRQQQAEFLQLCLECWASASACPGVSCAAADSSSVGSVGGGGADQPVNPSVVTKLADFVQEHEANMSAGQVLDLLEAAHPGAHLLLALCQELLRRASSSQVALPASLAMRYAQISASQLAGQVAGLQRQVTQLQRGPGPEGAPPPAGPSGSKQQEAAGLRPALTAAATGLLAAASLLGGNHVLLRLARVAPLLYLLRERGAGGSQQRSRAGRRQAKQRAPHAPAAPVAAPQPAPQAAAPPGAQRAVEAAAEGPGFGAVHKGAPGVAAAVGAGAAPSVDAAAA